VCRPLLCLCRTFMIFEGCLNSNSECCHSKPARFQLSHQFLFSLVPTLCILSCFDTVYLYTWSLHATVVLLVYSFQLCTSGLSIPDLNIWSIHIRFADLVWPYQNCISGLIIPDFHIWSVHIRLSSPFRICSMIYPYRPFV